MDTYHWRVLTFWCRGRRDGGLHAVAGHDNAGRCHEQWLSEASQAIIIACPSEAHQQIADTADMTWSCQPEQRHAWTGVRIFRAGGPSFHVVCCSITESFGLRDKQHMATGNGCAEEIILNVHQYNKLYSVIVDISILSLVDQLPYQLSDTTPFVTYRHVWNTVASTLADCAPPTMRPQLFVGLCVIRHMSAIMRLSHLNILVVLLHGAALGKI